MNQQKLVDEMQHIREELTGITDTAVAAVDGLLIAADAGRSIDTEGLAAIAAAGLGVARRTVAATERGELHRMVAYGSQGCAAVYPVGDIALFVVLGDEGLDLDLLHEEFPPVLERIGAILTDEQEPDEQP
ncbi:roadblock/LC7 domain-containing protein [Streptomyces sp. TRM66268-LWL]|uniref:Roadblock/LC7 domain-containing protein n=1 Tax=Streptomyces polyasparticus TaxID=2767826 RepID=A0ABR7SSB9_9ACTN|nr:roadblock/LC7 domain-containing protein [Streptomyces polyasparticus]MBC9717401.1 roadblock/LC7 domain-containing protein [Streptomyces polyasparticus]